MWRIRRDLGALSGLDASAIAAYAQNAGFTGNDLVTAVAVALAESSGNPNVYNPETGARGGTPQGKGSFGLWQIYLRDHPEFAGQNLYDPQTNANAAFAVYSRAGQSFNPWTGTYTTGRYQAYIPQALAALPQPDLSPPGGLQVEPAPVTIDASTGQPVYDPTPTPPLSAGVSGAPGNILLLTGAALAAYLIADFLEGL
jgi:hypothetical protein